MNNLIIILLLIIIIIIIFKYTRENYANYDATITVPQNILQSKKFNLIINIPSDTQSNTQSNTSNCAPTWEQCGGKGWTGTNSCCAGNNCVVGNEWYSQCIPTSS